MIFGGVELVGNNEISYAPPSSRQRIKSFCVAEPTQRLRWTEPRVMVFGVLSFATATVWSFVWLSSGYVE